MLDYSQGILNLPKSNVLQFKSSSYKVTIRPSGTEPKLKIYFEVKAQTKKALEQNKLALIDEILNRLNLK
jgi:phosphoglucomutase